VANALAARRSGVKALYLSGVAVDRGGLAAGARFLEKPFNAEALARKIREVLDDQSQAA